MGVDMEAIPYASPSPSELSCITMGSGVLRAQKLKTHLLRTQSPKVLPLKLGAGQNIALYASPTARDFFLESIYTLLVHSLAFFPEPLPSFSCVSYG